MNSTKTTESQVTETTQETENTDTQIDAATADEMYGTETKATETKVEGTQTEKTATETKVAASEKVETPATGYDVEHKEPVEEKKADETKETKVETKTDETVEDTYKDLKFEGVHEDDTKRVKDFAKKHKISKEAAQEIVDQIKSEAKLAEDFAAKQKKEADDARIKQRAAWYKEFKEDKVFGGVNFDQSRHNVERCLQDFMPELKKELTEAGTMLRPSVMRGLARIAEKVYSEGKLMTGDPKTKTEDSGKDDIQEMYS